MCAWCYPLHTPNDNSDFGSVEIAAELASRGNWRMTPTGAILRPLRWRGNDNHTNQATNQPRDIALSHRSRTPLICLQSPFSGLAQLNVPQISVPCNKRSFPGLRKSHGGLLEPSTQGRVLTGQNSNGSANKQSPCRITLVGPVVLYHC